MTVGQKPLNASECARELGVSNATVVNWFKDGVFPNAYQIGRAIRIPVSDIEAAKQRPFLQKEGA